MSEEDTFWTFAAMMKKLESYYQPNMKGVLNDNKVFGHVLRHALPELYNHLQSYKIDTLLFCSRWFLSLFTDFPNWETVLRIWDIFFLQGRKGLLRVSLAILRLCQKDMLERKGIEGLIPYIFHIPEHRIDPVLLFPAVLAIDIEQILDEIRQSTKERREKDKSANEVLSFFNQVRSIMTPQPSRKRSRTETTDSPRATRVSQTPRVDISNKRQKTSKLEFSVPIFETHSSIVPLAKSQEFSDFATPRREQRAMGKPKQEMTPILKRLTFPEAMESEEEMEDDSFAEPEMDAVRSKLRF